MSVSSLLKKYSEIWKEYVRTGDHKKALKQVKAVDRSVSEQISQDFGKYVAEVNKNLPDDRKVTEWSVHYDPRAVFITVTKLGDKPHCSGNFHSSEPLPRYLSEVKKFNRKYPIKEIYFSILDEMK